MDLTLLTGLVIALGGTAATVITALAAYQKAIASRSEERNLLAICWDTFERHNKLDWLPPRARRRIREIVNGSDDDERRGTDDAEAPVDA